MTKSAGKCTKPNVCICMCVWCKLTNTMVRAQAAWRRRKLSHHCFISLLFPFFQRRSWNKLLGRVCFHFWLWYFLAWSKGICYLQLCQLSTYSWFWLLKQTQLGKENGLHKLSQFHLNAAFAGPSLSVTPSSRSISSYEMWLNAIMVSSFKMLMHSSLRSLPVNTTTCLPPRSADEPKPRAWYVTTSCA